MLAFDSLAAFIEMEGHGPYVWTCYGVFFVALVVLVLWSRRRHRTILRQQRLQLNRDSSSDAKPAPAASFTRIHPS